MYTVQWPAFTCTIYTLYSHWKGAGMNNVHACVPDPDPHVFGPPGSRSGSISQRYGSGSGSFFQQAKIVLVPAMHCIHFSHLYSCRGRGGKMYGFSRQVSLCTPVWVEGRQTVLPVHRKKKVCEFPVPSRDVTTKLSLGGNNDVITELFLPRGSLVSDIPAGDGKLVNLFLRCRS
jgi:hypothetical protein